MCKKYQINVKKNVKKYQKYQINIKNYIKNVSENV